MRDSVDHDLTLLPKWGPYTKKYIGASHIANSDYGIRFDLSIFPSIYRRKTELPNVSFETNSYPWQANSRLTHYKFRHILEWQNNVYADIDYLLQDSNSQIFIANLVNNTNSPQTLALHLLASIHFAGKKEYEPDNYLQASIINFPNNAHWINSNEYHKYITQDVLPTDNLNPDGKFKHESLEHGYVNGSRIKFGFSCNDSIEYDLPQSTDDIIQLRYYSEYDTSILVKIDKDILNVTLPKILEPTLITLSNKPTQKIILIANDNKPFYLDGLLMVNRQELTNVTFSLLNLETTPKIIKIADGYLLKYPQLSQYYGVKFFAEDYELREFVSDNLDTFFARNANEHVLRKIIDKENEHHYSNWYLRPISLQAHDKESIFGLVTQGTYEEVIEKLQRTTLNSLQNDFTKLLPEYSETTLGQQIITATMLTNVVYPVYTCGKFIRHSTPGRWWDCLYTWDSGFIGLGLLELDVERAKENLKVYLTSNNAENKFIHHGSPVPVQFYLADEIYNKSGDESYLQDIFTSLLQYYRFLRGSLGSSDTNRHHSGLLQTWSYFYNSGGWDDYPAQKYCHDNGLIMNITPVITTSHVISCAKILSKFASIISVEDRIFKELINDVRDLSTYLNKYSWDNESGYFSYVMHNEDGSIASKLYANDGSNFNQGLDGLYPLVARVGTNEQITQMLNHLKNPFEINSMIGLSAVSQSASYYRNDGYWNGTIWFSHQWFFWKAMFDHNQIEFADKIAKTALDIWERECGLSYRSLEHFIIESGRGAGWSTFSGLSCPIINWYNAYYTSGRINCGLDCTIIEHGIHEDKFNIQIRKFINESTSLLAVLPGVWQNIQCLLDNVAINFKRSFSDLAIWLELPTTLENDKVFNIIISRG